MGCATSRPDSPMAVNRKRRQSSMGVGMGVAMMMQQAGVMMGSQLPAFDPIAIKAQIRKAKAEGRTVTCVNGSLYIDYHLIARVPDTFDLRM